MMVKAKVVGGNYGNMFVRRFDGIGFGIVILLIGAILLLKDLGYIQTQIGFWTYFFLIIGAWIVVSKVISVIRAN